MVQNLRNLGVLMKKQMLAAASAAVVFSLSGHASAAQKACSMGSPDVSMNVQPIDNTARNGGCEFSDSESQDFLDMGTPANHTVNVEQFFGFSDWVFDGKVEDPSAGMTLSTGTTIQMDFTGDGTPGSWSITNAPTFVDVMLVFKTGNLNNTNPGSLVGYMLDALSGSFELTGFGNNDQGKEISHISVYFRNNPDRPNLENPVPIPGAAWLMGAGLVVFARKRKAAQG